MGRGAVRAKERAEAQRRRAAADEPMFANRTRPPMGRSVAQRRAKAKRRDVKLSEPGKINRVDITSNENSNKTISVTSGVVNLKYYESLLQDGVVLDLTFVDSGDAIDGEPAVSGLPINGEENVQAQFTDNHGNSLIFNNEKYNSFYVRKVTPIGNDSTKSAVNLQLCTKEHIRNDKGSSVAGRLDGKISLSVKSILQDKEYLGSLKDLDIEETSNNVNYYGASDKPYYVLNRISKDAIPSGASGGQSYTGNSAGFLFYENYDSINFKSIDSLFGQDKKLSIVYNNSPGEANTPKGYDVKALTYDKDNTMDITKKLKAGAWNTKNIQFNPFTKEYNVSPLSAEEKEDYLELAGKSFPVFNKEFDRGEENKNFSRTTFLVNVPGGLVEGTGLGVDQQQLAKSQIFNYDAKSIMNQSIMRYNQLFSQRVTITIPGDFSLRAGDAVFFDVYELKRSKTKACGDALDKVTGGQYIIATLCHYMSPNATYSKLVLVRDSVGRKGNHTSEKSRPSSKGFTENFHGVKVPRSSGGNFL